MPGKIYRLRLEDAEREGLKSLANALDIGIATVARVRRRCVEEVSRRRWTVSRSATGVPGFWTARDSGPRAQVGPRVEVAWSVGGRPPCAQLIQGT